MSNLRLNSGKLEVSGSTIGFRFHANNEELENIQAEQINSDEKSTEKNEDFTLKCIKETTECKAKVEDDIDTVPDVVKDHWNLLGKKSSSVDSPYESAFSNPIETWKKLNVLKDKFAKTVEEKFSEMKIDRSVLSKTSRSKLMRSKENSSLSDSEDTSESSKLSEQWKDAENQILSISSLSKDNSEKGSNVSEAPEVENSMEEKKDSESELRNRKIASFSELVHLPDIKVATAKSELDGSILDGSFAEEVESGIEAGEHLETTDTESLDAFEGSSPRSAEGSETPPERVLLRTINSFTSLIISHYYAIVLLLSFILYFIFPLPDFIRGFLLSSLLAITCVIIKSYLKLDDVSQQKSFVMPNYKSMPPLKVPQHKPSKGVWVNEYEKEIYDPDYYSVTDTVPAYLELDDSILKLSKPKGRIRKRATFDEPEYKLQFLNRRTYDINGCNVYLMPEGLTKKRLFSKKYPIVIFLKPDSLISEKKNSKEVEDPNDSGEIDETSINVSEEVRNKSTLYLFARCDRQKQEWYRRLLTATRLQNSPDHKEEKKISDPIDEVENCDRSPSKDSSTPFENIFFDDDINLLEEYSRYMTQFVQIDVNRQEVKVKHHYSWYRKLKPKKRDAPGQEDDVDHLSMKNIPVCLVEKTGKPSTDEENESHKSEEINSPLLQIQWFNAFVNRILFDVFRSPYWLSKIHDKLQRKLNSVRLPYYIEDIEVVEMDLGKTGPTFHRVSQPSLDELGLWFDMDATFNGLIRLTIQTHLNLIKLQKGIEENETVQLEKMKKEKKKQKEAKDPLIMKESKEKSSESVTKKSKKIGKPDDSKIAVDEHNFEETPPDLDNGELEPKPSEDSRNKFMDEIAQLAEFAIEETLAEDKKFEKETKTIVEDCQFDNIEKLRSAIYDSELEDSAESSDEDEVDDEKSFPENFHDTEEQSSSVPIVKRYPRDRKSSKKIFKMFENVAQSKYFRSVAQSKYIQKAIANVSAAKLKLTLEIKSCTGTLAINVPPPPNDRFWYGFRGMPKLVFSANPKIGDKAVRFAHIRNYLQKKILHELKKVMVIPNMIDFVLPTSVQTRATNSPQFEDPDLQEMTPLE